MIRSVRAVAGNANDHCVRPQHDHERHARDSGAVRGDEGNWQHEKTVTASYIILTIIGPRIHLATMNSRYNCGMITALRTSLDKRMAACENNEVFRLASCLDTRFKLQGCRSSSQREAAMIAELSAKGVKYTSPAPTTEDVIATVSPARKRSKLFDFMTAFHFNVTMFHYCIVSMLKKTCGLKWYCL